MPEKRPQHSRPPEPKAVTGLRESGIRFPRARMTHGQVQQEMELSRPLLNAELPRARPSGARSCELGVPAEPGLSFGARCSPTLLPSLALLLALHCSLWLPQQQIFWYASQNPRRPVNKPLQFAKPFRSARAVSIQNFLESQSSPPSHVLQSTWTTEATIWKRFSIHVEGDQDTWGPTEGKMGHFQRRAGC